MRCNGVGPGTVCSKSAAPAPRKVSVTVTLGGAPRRVSAPSRGTPAPTPSSLITRLDAELEPSASFRHEVPTTTPSPSAQRACLGRVVSPGAADVLADGRLARVNQRGDVVGVVVVAAGDRALELADTAAERAAGVGH